MGDIVDMMLDGTLCQECGDFIGEGDGYPVSCSACRKPKKKKKKKIKNNPSSEKAPIAPHEEDDVHVAVNLD